MEYYDIIMKINTFNVLDFNMNDFNNLSNIIKEIKSIYEKSVLDGKLDARVHYDATMDHLYTIVFNILKQKLQFENEVISKIMYLIDYSDVIENVFILDGNVFAKIKNVDNNGISFIPLDNFFDITSNKFSKNTLNNNLKYLVIQSFNNAINPWLNDKLGNKKLLSMNNGSIQYNLVNTNVFVNNSLKSIIDSGANHIPQITKVVLCMENELYSFDMKIRDEYLILFHNNYPVNRLSTFLDTEEKVKKL